MIEKSEEKQLLKILYLEDSPLDAELVHLNLCENVSYDIQVDLVDNEKDFISAITSKNYGLILSDYMLPNYSGTAALEYVKSNFPNIPFICVSGFIGEESAVELLIQGANDYVLKNNLGRLPFAIERAINESRTKEIKKKRTEELSIANKELLIKNEIILELNRKDSLTGLYNRNFFELEKKRIDIEEKYPISIILGDINGLKLINDAFGYSEADELLIKTANILNNCCREGDIIARIGGDEFGIILPSTDSGLALSISKCIVETCKQSELEEGAIPYSISLGLATKENSNDSFDSIFKIAEELMSRQKLLESKSAHSALITSIKSTMFEKSNETAEHTERLAQLSIMIGNAMSLNEFELNELVLLAELHDIGKMSIDDKILSKKDKLTDEEWVEMRKHPEVGFRIAKTTYELIPVANLILCHHERWDGKGYPQGLIGDKIPLLSRILAIVDSFDAMTNDRVYRSAMTKEEAIEEIRKNSGTQFDPDISQLFLNIIS